MTWSYTKKIPKNPSDKENIKANRWIHQSCRVQDRDAKISCASILKKEIKKTDQLLLGAGVREGVYYKIYMSNILE